MIGPLAKRIITLLPQNTLSRLAGRLGRSRLSKYFIKPYISIFNINTEEIEKPVAEYPHLTAFFTRKLKAGTRPVCPLPEAIVSPVDGKVAQFGPIHQGTLIQAKNINYTVKQLLGCSEETAAKYEGGTFLTIYLSPRDYHRIHMPLDGRLTKLTYIPGRLFPVNSIGVYHVPGLFTKNERLITYASTSAGEIAIVKVGAFIVGSVKVAYGEHATNVKNGQMYSKRLNDGPVYKKGEEVGLFEFGSTVILLFKKDKIALNERIRGGTFLRYGEQIGTIIT
ncbi:archaetidylserine decarboxylase [Aneurinibacillus thermoaerophilus]|uniref:Phosphatidylserine decarboxylase proenzyme n=1 Tax=Aneurinibacillus thermoaerophilus TaxID=143495 RepID=A0A1G7WVA2_ANETH|nr:archaetidylserine decarboxylase [Aneurinibacillus thermoaerophilus]MED0737692.1 archaetidylserine decarboxylase [Aneurinibacillus thermoaerophilus]QYY43480.1 archaetidylserine decarboxylase [Aneurinibacillus thermoaerophilus]SDG75806.1 phosphatidylserine decarboxylase [Aneurinibacillus thermoaerophilus]